MTIGEFFNNSRLEYLSRHDVPTWGVANVTTVLQYNVEFADLPEWRKKRDTEVFSGLQTKVTYAGFTVTLTRYNKMH